MESDEDQRTVLVHVYDTCDNAVLPEACAIDIVPHEQSLQDVFASLELANRTLVSAKLRAAANSPASEAVKFFASSLDKPFAQIEATLLRMGSPRPSVITLIVSLQRVPQRAAAPSNAFNNSEAISTAQARLDQASLKASEADRVAFECKEAAKLAANEATKAGQGLQEAKQALEHAELQRAEQLRGGRQRSEQFVASMGAST